MSILIIYTHLCGFIQYISSISFLWTHYISIHPPLLFLPWTYPLHLSSSVACHNRSTEEAKAGRHVSNVISIVVFFTVNLVHDCVDCIFALLTLYVNVANVCQIFEPLYKPRMVCAREALSPPGEHGHIYYSTQRLVKNVHPLNPNQHFKTYKYKNRTLVPVINV